MTGRANGVYRNNDFFGLVDEITNIALRYQG